jgi:1-acyl-sn-glycerol-3-phosphate acyltransferase
MTKERSAPPSIGYRIIRAVCLMVARFLFDVRVEGYQNMPPPGSIVAGVPHRNWAEPVLLFAILPARPRQVGIADGPTVSRSLLRRLIIKAGGGVIKVQPRSGPSGFEAIARATTDWVDRGAVVVIFPESGRPSRAPALRTLSAGVGHLAARSRAPVVPVVVGGTHELYLRRRIVISVLPPIDPPAAATRPAVAAFMGDLEKRTKAAAIEVHQAAESAGPRRKVGRWLSGRYPRAEQG